MYSPCKTTNRSTIVLAYVFAWSGMALPGFADGATRDLPDSYTAGVASRLGATSASEGATTRFLSSRSGV